MNYKYTPRFTPCARSIQVLKGEASTIKKSTESMSHRDSLDSVAKLYGYSNWNEIINSKNPFRDKFFAEMYSQKGKSAWKDIYKNYLKTKELTDCADSFRMFVVEHYKSFEKLGINNIDRTGTRIDDDVLLQELVDHLQAKSIAGFLPQNLPSYLLNGLLYEFKIFHEGKESEDSNASGILLVTLSILSFQRKSQEISISFNELSEHMDNYYLALLLESITRRTEVSFYPPTLENIFNKDRSVMMKFETSI